MGIKLFKGLDRFRAKQMEEPVQIFDYPSGLLCRGYHNRGFLHEGIFYRFVRRLVRMLSLGFVINPLYWILKPVIRFSVYPFWRLIRFAVFRLQVFQAARLQYPVSRAQSAQNENLREVVLAQARTEYDGRLRLSLWRHKDPLMKTCVICFPNPRQETQTESCFWPLEKYPLPCHWVQFDYRKMGKSTGAACRFQELVDDAQAIMMYSKAFLGSDEKDFILIGEGLGALFAQALSLRFEKVTCLSSTEGLSKTSFRTSLFKKFFSWLMGWPSLSLTGAFKVDFSILDFSLGKSPISLQVQKASIKEDTVLTQQL